jgi:hypothetical protein
VKSMSNPRPLLPFTAMFSRRGRAGAGADEVQDTRMPDDEDVLMLQSLAGSQVGRIAAEVALEEGGRRQYAPRRETEVLEARQRREGAR